MHEPTFRQALISSWRLVAHKKSLWIFGILSALLGQWGISDIVGSLYQTSSRGFQFWDLNVVASYFTAWNWHKVSVILLLLWLFGIMLLLFVGVVFLAVSARGAIIAYAIHWYKKEKIIPLAEAWHLGVKKFFPLLIITVVSRLLQFLIVCLFALLASYLINYSGFFFSLLIVLSAAVALFLAMVVEAISIYSSGYLLLRAEHTLDAIKKGWNLFLNHILVTLELGIILLAFSFVFLVVIIYASLLAFLPSVLLWLVAGFAGLNSLVAFGLYMGMTIYAALVLVVAGIFNAFVTVSWMYFFMKMHHEGIPSRLIHFLSNIFRKN